jgi:hypothetical protein
MTRLAKCTICKSKKEHRKMAGQGQLGIKGRMARGGDEDDRRGGRMEKGGMQEPRICDEGSASPFAAKP